MSHSRAAGVFRRIVLAMSEMCVILRVQSDEEKDKSYEKTHVEQTINESRSE